MYNITVAETEGPILAALVTSLIFPTAQGGVGYYSHLIYIDTEAQRG